MKVLQQRPGNALLMAMLFLVVIGTIVAALLSRGTLSYSSATFRVSAQKAVQIAESGIEKAVWCLNNPTAGCPGGSSFTGETDVTVGNGTYTTDVSIAGNNATVTSTATVQSNGRPVEKQIVAKLKIAASVTPAFQFGVQSGIGGIVMSNNSHIDGNIYTAGSVTGSNGSYITGDAVLAPSAGSLDVVSNPSVTPSPNLSNFGADNNVNDVIAQSFVPSITDRVYSVDLKLARVNSPTSTVKIQIYSDNSNTPGSDLSAGGKTITVGSPNSTDPAWWGTDAGNGTGWTTQLFNPATNPILNSGTKYWLVLTTSSSNSAKYWEIVRAADDTAYGSGSAKIGGALGSLSPLCAGGCDIGFRVTLGGVPPTLSLPSVQGNARAHTINNTTIGGKAYYQELAGTVQANGGADTCADDENGPYCYDNTPDEETKPFPLEDSQISVMEGQAAAGGTQNTNCSIPDGATIGPKKFDCDVTINGTVTLNGTVWVNGDLTVINSAVLRLSEGYGSSSGTIVVDYPADRSLKGRINLSNGSNIAGNSNSGTYIMVISMYDNQTSTDAITVSNNLSGGVLFAPLGIVSIYNNASLKEVTALKISLSNNASVVYETGLASAIFTSGPGAAWSYDKGTYQIIE